MVTLWLATGAGRPDLRLGRLGRDDGRNDSLHPELLTQHSVMDDLTLVPIMTGHEPVSLRWLWSQHNEHRSVVSRLILVGPFRFISSDFRVGLYSKAALLPATAASMLVWVRRLRGYTSWFVVALLVAILSIGQAETLLIGLALALMLTSWISCELIGLASAQDFRRGGP